MAYDFLTTSEHAKFSEAHVERRAQVSSIRLLHDDYIYRTGKRGRVDFTVEFFEVAKYFICNAKHVLILLMSAFVKFQGDLRAPVAAL